MISVIDYGPPFIILGDHIWCLWSISHDNFFFVCVCVFVVVVFQVALTFPYKFSLIVNFTCMDYFCTQNILPDA